MNADLQEKMEDLENKLTETIKLLSERSRECGKLEAEVKVLKAFVMKVHTSPVIFEDVNRALRDEAKTLLEKLNQSAESVKMKDKNGIGVECQNCASVNYCKDSFVCEQCLCQNGAFLPSEEAFEARIAELQEHNDILQKRVAELSMELLDYNMKENKDVLERLKEE